MCYPSKKEIPKSLGLPFLTTDPEVKKGELLTRIGHTSSLQGPGYLRPVSQGQSPAKSKVRLPYLAMGVILPPSGHKE